MIEADIINSSGTAEVIDNSEVLIFDENITFKHSPGLLNQILGKFIV